MSDTSLIVINSQLPATIKESRGNYKLAIPNGMVTDLKRNVDFGNPVTKKGANAFPQPILYKGGAEKIIKDYQVFPTYALESAVEDAETGYFFYRFKCELKAFNPATNEFVVVQEGVGSANSRESKTGNQSGFDAANSVLKNARKRSMVDAAISLAGLSSIFTQDMENTNFMEGAYDVVQAKEDEPITSKQRQRVFAIASQRGMSNEQTKTWLKSKGFASVKDILQKDYDGLCDELEKVGAE
jgi:hypothetical protein